MVFTVVSDVSLAFRQSVSASAVLTSGACRPSVSALLSHKASEAVITSRDRAAERKERVGLWRFCSFTCVQFKILAPQRDYMCLRRKHEH